MDSVNKYLGEAKISKLIFKFSIPCIMGLLISALYNIVDQIFIGRGVGYLGNGATNVVFPITVLAMAFGMLPLMLSYGVGANGNRALSTGTVGGLIIGTFGLLFTVPVFFIFFQRLQEKIKPIPGVTVEEKESEERKSMSNLK